MLKRLIERWFSIEARIRRRWLSERLDVWLVNIAGALLVVDAIRITAASLLLFLLSLLGGRPWEALGALLLSLALMIIVALETAFISGWINTRKTRARYWFTQVVYLKHGLPLDPDCLDRLDGKAPRAMPIQVIVIERLVRQTGDEVESCQDDRATVEATE